MSNFNEQRSRYGTYSTQWDYVQDRFGEKDLLPFSISDTDFMIPDGTIAVLDEAVTKGFSATRAGIIWTIKKASVIGSSRNLIVLSIQNGVSIHQV